MKLIKQLNENMKTSMDEETFNRLVEFALEDIKAQLPPDASDAEMLDLIMSLIEDVPGFEDARDAVKLGKRVLDAVKTQIAF